MPACTTQRYKSHPGKPTRRAKEHFGDLTRKYTDKKNPPRVCHFKTEILETWSCIYHFLWRGSSSNQKLHQLQQSWGTRLIPNTCFEVKGVSPGSTRLPFSDKFDRVSRMCCHAKLISEKPFCYRTTCIWRSSVRYRLHRGIKISRGGRQSWVSSGC